jgi:hypothetical protein
MQSSVKLVIVAIVTIMFVLIIAQSLFNSNIKYLKYQNESVSFDVDVVYVYFSTQPVGESIVGLYRSNNSPYIPVSFFVVLNVTNYSNVSVAMSTFSITAAQEITIEDIPSEGYSRRVAQPFFMYQQTCQQQKSLLSSFYDSVIWQPYESKLVALSGIAQFSDYTLLQTGTFYISGEVEGNVIDGFSGYFGGGAKLIHIKNFGDNYLYNILVAENETLRISTSGLVEVISEN